jgi:hypothetical protein
MCHDPPFRAQPAGRGAGVKLSQSNNFIHSAPPQAIEMNLE